MIKQWQFMTTVMLAGLCLLLSVASIISGKANQNLQAQVQAQQIEINKGTTSQQIGGNIVRDIASAATKNSKLRDLLTRQGFTLTENPGPSPSP
jgi:hypothetical protein